MNDDMKKRREFDEVSSAMAFENKAYANGTVGEIRYLHSWWREGAKWQFADMQAHLDYKESALKFQTKALIREMNLTEKLQIENNSLKQALDLAVCGILAIKDYTSLHEQRKEKWGVQYIYAIEQKINEALTSINEIINKTKQGESNG